MGVKYMSKPQLCANLLVLYNVPTADTRSRTKNALQRMLRQRNSDIRRQNKAIAEEKAYADLTAAWKPVLEMLDPAYKRSTNILKKVRDHHHVTVGQKNIQYR
jgi:hypothetical protein